MSLLCVACPTTLPRSASPARSSWSARGEASVRAALRGASAEIAFVRQAHPDGTAAAALLGAAGIDSDTLVVAGDSVTDRANLAALRERLSATVPWRLR
jgi:dTDP-glucose pyrophosphorylase